MAITVGTDTYITLANADTYVENNYVSTDTTRTTWEALSDSDKELYLKKATKRIDRLMLNGVKAVSTQTLEFPRAIWTDTYRNEYPNLNVILDGNWYIESEVSDNVKNAQVEEALSLLTEGSTANERIQLQQQGVKSFKIGNFSESLKGLSSNYNSTSLLSAEGNQLLKTYIAGGVPIV